MRPILAATALVLATLPAAAQDVATAPFDGDVEDAAFAVEAAIVNRGLVVVYQSDVGEMLARTGADLGLGPSPVGDDARVFLFCSATVSRQVMEADPLNVANCPYAVFVAEIGGETLVGRRVYPQESMAPVNALLDGIVAEATE